MSARAGLAGLLAGFAAATGAVAQPPTTQAQAFDDGKAYKPANTDIKAGIKDSALDNVPGQDAGTTADLKGLYGINLNAPGQSKIVACATYAPGTDAYKNQECDTVNYVVGNPGTRPGYTIDKINDPILIRGNDVRNAPQAHTAGTTGLSGNYTACTNQTIKQPERFDTERCQTGSPVTEAQCSAALNVTYSWRRYAGQASADLRYGRCGAGQVRGDQLTIPFTNAYRTEQVACAGRGHGTGAEELIWYTDCTGNDALHGYSASGCSIQPDPVVSDPPHHPITSCANAPRNNENCFTPVGQFTDKVEAPVFQDNWDYSACADLNSHGAVIKN